MAVVSPVLGWRARIRHRGSSVPAAGQELSWLWGSLGCRGGAEPVGIATEERRVGPQHLSSGFETQNKKTSALLVSDLSCCIKKTFQLIL